MITIKAEQEHYCLVTDGESGRVVERRAGKYYPLGNCARRGVALDEPEAPSLFRDGPRFSESAPVAGWRMSPPHGATLFEHIR